MSKKTKTIKLDKDGYKTEWWSEGQEIYVNILNAKDKLILEWSYSKISGCGGLVGQAHFWLDQAILQAKVEEEKG